MAGEDDVIMRLDTDGSSTLEVIDAIDTGLQALTDAIASVAESAGELTALDDSLGAVAENLDVATGSMDNLESTLSILVDAVSTLTDSVGSLESQMAGLTAATEELTAATEGASAGLETTGTAADDAAVGLEGLQAAAGPLLMIGTIAGMVGGKIVGMGMDGQKGEALLRGMAGASQQDIQALQSDALQLGETMDQASAGFYEVESAGYSGSDALKVFDAASRLAIGGQASQQDVMSGLTAIMHDYNATADQATQYTDYMSEAIVRGKQSAQDFTANIGPLAASAANVGISFDQVSAAESTMTQINPHVAQDAQQLKSLFDFLSPSMGGVEKAAKKLGLAFDEQKYSSLDLIGKLQYLSDLAGGTNTAAFTQLTGGVRGSTAAIDLMQNKASSFNTNLAAMKNSTGATQNAFGQFENTVPGHLDKVGASLSTLGTRLMDAIGPKVNPIIDGFSHAIGGMADFMTQHIDLAMPILAGLAVMVGVILVAAFTALAVPVLVATWPILAIAAAIGLLVVGIILLVQHFGQIIKFFGQFAIVREIAQAFQQFGAYIGGAFAQIWQQLVAMWQSQVMPLFKQFAPVVEPIKTALLALGALIMTGPVVVFGLLVGVINGVIHAFLGMLRGLVTFIGGVIQLFVGIVQVISGIIAFIVDLVTGHFNKLGADLGVIGKGIVNIFTGMWNMIKGAFQAGIGLIVGFVSGFIEGIVGFFTHLWDLLVRHSIIPDMINGIVNSFEQLPGRAMQFVTNLVSQITGSLGNLGSMALQWAGDMIDNFVNGIKNGLSKIGDAAKSIGDQVKKFLGFSVPEEGPLSDADQYMPDMVELFARGISGNQDKLKAAISGMAQQMAVTVQPGALPTTLGSFGGAPTGDNQAIILLQQIAQTLQQIAQQSQGSAQPTTNLLFNTQQPATINNQAINQLVQLLSGYGYESVQRGGY